MATAVLNVDSRSSILQVYSPLLFWYVSTIVLQFYVAPYIISFKHFYIVQSNLDYPDFSIIRTFSLVPFFLMNINDLGC